MNKILDNISNVLSSDSKILSSSEDLIPYLRGTEGLDKLADKKRMLLAAVKVATTDDVQAMLKLANNCANTPQAFVVFPISSGRNWGYGTSQPASVVSNAIILDMSDLKYINLNEELGHVTLEPGVTQQDLANFLERRNSDYMVPVTGAGPDCSIIGNAVERGYGITPWQDHFAAVNSLSGYWGNALPFESALTELDGTAEKLADKSFKWGLGPYLDGLFTQSNLGIVTSMTIRLANKPDGFISFFAQYPNDRDLEAIVPVLRKTLANYAGLVGAINLMDKRRIVSMFADNPDGPSSHQVMSNDSVEQAAKKLDTPAWTVIGSLYGSKAVVKAAKKEIKAILKQVSGKTMFSDELLLKAGNFFVPRLPDFIFKLHEKLAIAKEQVESFQKGQEIMLGKPNRVALGLCYWRNPNSLDKNAIPSPGKDGCGLLWYAPLIPLTPSKVREYVDFIRDTCPKYNIEPFITMTHFHHDSVDSTVPIVFDLNNPSAVKDAHDCLIELTKEGIQRGFISYRLNIDQQQWLLNQESNFWQATAQIKLAMDPNNVISPGRYNPTK